MSIYKPRGAIVLPKGSPELTEKRKNEILDACRRVYEEKGFNGVNIKGISADLSMTRPAIYYYFHTKEEILLGLLIREFDAWAADLEEIKPRAGTRVRAGLAEDIASSLEHRDILLRMLNMNFVEIEQNSRVERLAEFKTSSRRADDALAGVIRAHAPRISDAELAAFTRTFGAFLFGVYPPTHTNEAQREAARLAGLEPAELSVADMVKECLMKLLPYR